jgi:hypothetical protein
MADQEKQRTIESILIANNADPSLFGGNVVMNGKRYVLRGGQWSIFYCALPVLLLQVCSSRLVVSRPEEVGLWGDVDGDADLGHWLG